MPQRSGLCFNNADGIRFDGMLDVERSCGFPEDRPLGVSLDAVIGAAPEGELCTSDVAKADGLEETRDSGPDCGVLPCTVQCRCYPRYEGAG